MNDMTTDTLRKEYSLMSDDELLALHADSNSLSEEARPILSEEIRRRSITEVDTVAREIDAYVSETESQSTLAKSPFASSFLNLFLFVLLVSFVLKVLGIPLEVSLPGTLIAFLVRYYIAGRLAERKKP